MYIYIYIYLLDKDTEIKNLVIKLKIASKAGLMINSNNFFWVKQRIFWSRC